MSLVSKIVFTIIYTTCFLILFSFVVRPTNIFGLLTLPCTFLFLCIFIWSLIIAFREWKRSRLWAIVPLTLCLFLFPAAKMTGNFTRSELFKLRFSRYEALVKKVESGAIPISAEEPIISPTNYDSSLAKEVFASRDTNGTLVVSFLYGGAGPPPYHELYLYISSGIIEPGSALDKRYWGQKKIREKWFLVED